MHGATILVVDDEQPILNLLTGYLRAEGYHVFTARDGPSALAQMFSIQPALVVLDIMLPGMDGIEVCRRIQQDYDVYVLMLTARGEEVDKLIGLSVGADDYLTKPFSPRELVARVKTILRRSRTPGPRAPAQRFGERPSLHFEELTLDPSGNAVWRSGIPVSLTPREFDLLYVLAEQAGRVCTRDQLLDRVWGSGFAGVDRVVDVHINQLRRKLESDMDAPTLIQTIRGVGYRLVARRLD